MALGSAMHSVHWTGWRAWKNVCHQFVPQGFSGLTLVPLYRHCHNDTGFCWAFYILNWLCWALIVIMYFTSVLLSLYCHNVPGFCWKLFDCTGTVGHSVYCTGSVWSATPCCHFRFTTAKILWLDLCPVWFAQPQWQCQAYILLNLQHASLPSSFLLGFYRPCFFASPPPLETMEKGPLIKGAVTWNP